MSIYPHPNDPDWENASKVHDWRNHVGKALRDIWGTFTDKQRMVIAEEANERASQEEWE